jgi:hypothetical protein
MARSEQRRGDLGKERRPGLDGRRLCEDWHGRHCASAELGAQVCNARGMVATPNATERA